MKIMQNRSFRHYFHAAISIHLSEKSKNMLCFIWFLNTGLTVHVSIAAIDQIFGEKVKMQQLEKYVNSRQI